MVSWLLAAALGAGLVRVEMPTQLTLDPISLGELAQGAAVVWDGGALPPVPVVVRRVPAAFRLILPPSLRPEALQVEVRVKGGHLQGEGRGLVAKATLLSLRWVESRPEGEVYEGEVLLHLDPSKAPAGTFAGTLEVSVVGR